MPCLHCHRLAERCVLQEIELSLLRELERQVRQIVALALRAADDLRDPGYHDSQDSLAPRHADGRREVLILPAGTIADIRAALVDIHALRSSDTPPGLDGSSDAEAACQ